MKIAKVGDKFRVRREWASHTGLDETLTIMYVFSDSYSGTDAQQYIVRNKSGHDMTCRANWLFGFYRDENLEQ